MYTNTHAVHARTHTHISFSDSYTHTYEYTIILLSNRRVTNDDVLLQLASGDWLSIHKLMADMNIWAPSNIKVLIVHAVQDMTTPSEILTTPSENLTTPSEIADNRTSPSELAGNLTTPSELPGKRTTTAPSAHWSNRLPADMIVLCACTPMHKFYVDERGSVVGQILAHLLDTQIEAVSVQDVLGRAVTVFEWYMQVCIF